MTVHLMRLAHLDLVKQWLFDHPRIALEQIVQASRGGVKGITSYLSSGVVLNNQGSYHSCGHDALLNAVNYAF